MQNIRKQRPRTVWNIFADICAIPHPSGKEWKLARHLRAFAKEHGLKAVLSRTGNLIIERPASPGLEKGPIVILQGHLDMVCTKQDGIVFDFDKDPIIPVIEGDRVSTGGRTTLGADNGIGVAIALAVITDASLKCGPLKVICTCQEENGLRGAALLKPKDLKADYLINLDCESEGIAFVGCAGGAYYDIRLPLSYVSAPVGVGVRLNLTGLRGGHSGENIADNRGNAFEMLVSFLKEYPELRIASLGCEGICNAIPRSAEAVCVVAPDAVDSLRKASAAALKIWKNKFDLGNVALFQLRKTKCPQNVWTSDCQIRILHQILKLPIGVLGRKEIAGQTILSNNIGRVICDEKNLTLYTHPRANFNWEMRLLLSKMDQLVHSFGGSAEVPLAYPAWELPEQTGMLFGIAAQAYRKLFRKELKAALMHGGIECGLFAGLNADLEMIALGPVNRSIHSPYEYVEIPSVERIYKLLRYILRYMSVCGDNVKL